MDSKDPKNVLLIGQSEVISEGLLQIALAEAELGKSVLYFASKPVEKLPEVFVRQDRSVLKRIFFMYFKSLEELIQKLMNLHNMFSTPSLIIIESLHLFFTPQQRKNLDLFLQGNAKIFAGLHSCVESFGGGHNGPCWSIVSLDDNEGYSQQCLTTFIDLFYYKKNYLRAVDLTFVQWLNQFKLNFVK